MQFNLRTTFAATTLFAVACAVCTTWRFGELLPGVGVAALFSPILGWLLVSLTRDQIPSIARWVYGGGVVFTGVVGLQFLAEYGTQLMVIAGVVLLVIWLPQVIFVAFFEACEHEHRTVVETQRRDAEDTKS